MRNIDEVELEKVTGGANGHIPDSGITFSDYSVIEENCFYTRGSFGMIAHVRKIDGNCCYFRVVTLTSDGDEWFTGGFTKETHSSIEYFKNRYPKKLNIYSE